MLKAIYITHHATPDFSVVDCLVDKFYNHLSRHQIGSSIHFVADLLCCRNKLENIFADFLESAKILLIFASGLRFIR